jgi:hypothetical protein
MNNWISELKTNLATEFDKRPAVATLATVNAVRSGSQADARSVVVRDLLEDGTLIITSDARSEKNSQLRSNPSATLVFWLPTLRWQCIVRADATIFGPDASDAMRLQQWQKLSDATRAMFTWPVPGEVFDPSIGFSRKVGANDNPPESFEVLMLNPLAVETLDVWEHPHRRVMWDKAGGGWMSRVVNP